MAEKVENSFIGTDDFLVLCIGGFILVAALALFFVGTYSHIDDSIAEAEKVIKEESEYKIKSPAWHQAQMDFKNIQGAKTDLGSFLNKWTGKPGGWKNNPLVAMQLSSAKAARRNEEYLESHRTSEAALESALRRANDAHDTAKKLDFNDEGKNKIASQAIEQWQQAKASHQVLAKKTSSQAFSKWIYLLALFVFLTVLFGGAEASRGQAFTKFAKGFLFVFGIAFISYLIAGQTSVKNLGIGYAAWAILIGLIISNTIGTPSWTKPALLTEVFIKTGLILLGAEILFGKILAIGLPGIFVAWVVTPIVLISTYWFGQKVLKISSRTLNITISADMSVCGVSAAVATAAASKASKEELTLAIGLSMVFTSVMMIVLPLIINTLGLPEILGGAWIGGTIDATGAVVAAGAFLGEDALNVAATIKMIQNVLIGIIAFGVAIYFARLEGTGSDIQIGWSEVWTRFPKFILGFIGASIIFSVIYAALSPDMAYAILDQGVLGGFTKNIRGWLFCLAFVSIGLSTNFKMLKTHFSGGKPLILYICGQAFNLGLTLLMAYIMFYLIFPDITANI